MNQMKTVKDIINNWDPINIMTFSPDNEYHTEISEIEHLLNTTENEFELGTGIYNVFLRSFDDVFKRSKADCIAIARSIIEAVSNEY